MVGFLKRIVIASEVRLRAERSKPLIGSASNKQIASAAPRNDSIIKQIASVAALPRNDSFVF